MGEADVGWRGPAWYVELVTAWVSHLQRRGRSRNTLRTYGWPLRHFGNFLARKHVEQPADLSPRHLHEWQDGIAAAYRPHAQVVATSAIRGLLRWAAREQLGVPAGLWDRLDSVHVPEDLPRPLEPATLRAVLEHYARPSRSLERLRDRALFLFLVTSSCRVAECIQVDTAQLRGRMVVRQKGGRDHVLVVSEQARVWIADYLRARGRDEQPALWVRVGPRGRHRLREQDVNAVWRGLAEQLGVQPWTTHALRHTGATELLEHGATELDVARHLGHANLGTVHRYAKIRDARRQELVNRLDDLVPEQPPAPAPRRRPRRYRVVRRDEPA